MTTPDESPRLETCDKVSQSSPRSHSSTFIFPLRSVYRRDRSDRSDRERGERNATGTGRTERTAEPRENGTTSPLDTGMSRLSLDLPREGSGDGGDGDGEAARGMRRAKSIHGMMPPPLPVPEPPLPQVASPAQGVAGDEKITNTNMLGIGGTSEKVVTEEAGTNVGAGAGTGTRPGTLAMAAATPGSASTPTSTVKNRSAKSGGGGTGSAAAPSALSADKLASIEQYLQKQSQIKSTGNPNKSSRDSESTDSLGVPPTPSSGAETGTDAEPELEPETAGITTTTRFQHVETPDGHHVLTGRVGELRRCEDEPITTPGAIQSFGVLMVLEEDYENETLAVRQVSENSTQLLGLSPQYLFRLASFGDILDEEQENLLWDKIEFLPDPSEERMPGEYEGPQVFRLKGRGESKDDGNLSPRTWTCWVAASRPRSAVRTDEHGNTVTMPQLVILEFELENDTLNPLHFEDDIEAVSTSHSGDPRSHSGSDAASLSMSPRTNASGGAQPRPSRPVYNRRTSSAGLSGPDDYEPSLDQIMESTTNYAKPIGALRPRRRESTSTCASERRRSILRRSGPGRRRRQTQANDTLDVFAVLNQINEQLMGARDLENFLNIAVGVIKDVSLFHRVLIYQFDEEMNGKAVTELVDTNFTNDLFKGLMFPASDIPPQARQLYVINKVRFLYDRSQPTARMVLRDKADVEYPLDMTHCFLRAMSPIHLKYLENMGVRSSMSISIVAFGKLWGLIACHSYGSHGMRVSFPVRQMLRILSDQISRHVERLTYAKRLDAQKAVHSSGIATLAGLDSPSSIEEEGENAETSQDETAKGGYIGSNAGDLLSIFEADSGLLVINEACKLLGSGDSVHAMLGIAEYFHAAKFSRIKASNNIAVDFPDLPRGQVGDQIGGVLYIPLSAEAGQDFMVFFRKEQVHTVKWAGKPYRDENESHKASLEPRKSFKLWTEQVRGKARDWTEEQLESATVLSVQYGKFIQVWRDKQHTMASSQLTAILLSNTSHALRTPLSQIINTLELAMTGNIDVETRDMLENSRQASRALLFHVHDLLDLTQIETGNETVFNDPFNLRQTITDAVRLYQTEAQRRGVEFNLVLADNLPHMLIGDQRKVRTVIGNLVANAVKYTDEGSVQLECYVLRRRPTSRGSSPADADSRDGSRTPPERVDVEIAVRDTGCGISQPKLEAMFVALEGANDQPKTVGLGLAVVARIVEQLQGQLRAESEVGKGTTVYFTFSMGATDMKPLRELSPSRQDTTAPETDESAAPAISSTTPASSTATAVGSPKAKVPKDTDVSLPMRIGSSSSSSSASVTAVPGNGGSSQRSSSTAAVSAGVPAPIPVRDGPTSPNHLSGRTMLTQANVGANSIAIIKADAIANAHAKATAHAKADDIDLVNGHAHADGDGTLNTNASQHQPTPTPTPKTTPKKPKANADAKAAWDPSKLRVLIAEDDVINAMILRKRLQMDGHKVHAVETGQEAVDFLAADWGIDVVLMDIQMPIMDGWQATAEIRRLERTNGPFPATVRDRAAYRIDNRIPVVAVSASLYEKDCASMAVDFDGWLLKPLNFERVREVLGALQDPSGAKRDAEVYRVGHWERGGFFKPHGGAKP